MGPASRDYALAPVFSVRAAGVPFEVLEALGTPRVAEAARALLAAEAAVDRAGEEVVANDALGRDERAIRAQLKKQVRARRPITDAQRAALPWLDGYGRAAVEYARALARLEEVMEVESLRVRRQVRASAVEILPDFAVIESEAMLDELASIAAGAPPVSPVNASDRRSDRSLAMYLQRVCAKNDTINRFGPSGWGRVVAGLAGLRIAPAPGLAARRIEVERWVVIGVIDVMNADPEVLAEVCPRLHPDVVLEGGVATRVDTGQVVELAADALALALRCDGATPAHRLGDVAPLVAAGVVIWQLERFAVDASPLASLVADVAGWREGDVRARWLARLERLRALAAQVGEADGARSRRGVLASFRAELAALGVAERDRGRTLYAAANPVSDNCFRECGIELGAGEAVRVVNEAAPWFDLFHDAYALAVARAFGRYRELVVAAPRRGALSYAELIAFARSREVEIENDGALLRAGVETFAEVKAALAEVLGERADAEEWQLTADDCHVLRRRHDLPAVAEFSYPQADLQLAAGSLADVAAGRYTWVVAELHHAFMQLQHVLYWPCPDKPVLHAAMAAALEHQPYAVRGALTEQPVHVAGEGVFDALARATFVGRGRPKPGWRTVRRVDAEVILDDAARDIRLRDRRTGDDLGSLVRGFRLLMGMHPFFPFERAPHAPRLRIGGTVVQRQTWNITSAEIGEPRPVGLSPAFLTGIERLRRERGVPRWVFVRSTSDRLRSFDVYARDKDLKPIYIDLESTLFLEILERRLRKYGELVASEMLPAPDQLVWTEPAGRMVFELRTSVIPR